MTFRLTRAADKKENRHVLAAFAGPSGSGKTMSALLFARGLAGPNGRIAFIDTEAGRGLHYRDYFDFHHGDLEAPFRPNAYIEPVNMCAAENYDVVVIDSMSHVWDGVGGVLEMAENNRVKSGKDGLHNWAGPKAEHKAMLNRMLQVRTHIVFCLRAADKVKAVRNQQTGKQEIVHAGLMPVCEKDFMFEMTFSLMLHPEAPGVPHPMKLSDTFKGAFPAGQPVTERAGEYLRSWSTGEASDQETARLWIEARRFASQGKAAFAEYWRSLNGEQRDALRIITNDLKSACAAADSRAEREQQAQQEFEDGVVADDDEDVNAPF